ncbi:TPA: funZ protein, partial [Klebsiella michiganensis]
MIPIKDLTLGYADAENYKRRENKDLLNKVFIRDNHLSELCEPNISFLVGEKGTGKTAYSIYLSNNNINNTLATTK